jgi:hypothetical protein
MRKGYGDHYYTQMWTAKKRGIEWNFTYDSWLDWWGADIINRGRNKGQLVMARYGDIGPYHPDNVRKLPVEENIKEANVGRKHTEEHSIKKGLARKAAWDKLKAETV